ncbi:MAG: choice-of-anchor D domain-containing protein [Polaribacter sp.]|nr:choice-of-anchor D domain-containing protein [Polaribacter sp.]
MQNAIAQNTIVFDNKEVSTATSFDFDISLNNTDEIAAIQFDITFNATVFELVNGHVLSSRASNNHDLAVSNPSEGIVRVVIYSATNTAISGNSGILLTLKLKSKTLPGNFSLNHAGLVVSSPTQSSVSTTINNGTLKVLGAILNISTTSINFGRVPIGNAPQRTITVSNSGNTNLELSGTNDISPFSILESFPITISPNASKNLSITVATTNKYNSSESIIFQNNDADPLRKIKKVTLSANVYAVNEIHIGSGSGEIHNEISIPVSINNMEPFSGFQFDITLPQNITYVNNSVVLSSRKDDHVVSGNMIDTNTLRIISYSNSNAEFSGVDGIVMSFKLKPEVSSGNYNLTISNPIISNIALGNIESDSYSGSVQINSPNLVTSPNSISFGRVPITETREQTIRLTNNGSAELIINSIVKDVSLFNIDTATPFSIAQGEFKDIKLTFTPNSIGTVNQNISIRHNGATEQNVINVTADVFSPNYLKVKNITAEPGSSSFLDIELYNNNEVRAIQFDITLNSEFNYNISNYSLIDNGSIFNSSTSNLGTNTFRFILYNISGETIPKGSGSILRIPFNIPQNTNFGDYTVSFTNVFISGPSNTNVGSEALNIGYINVNDNTPPVITLLGDANVTIEVGTSYTDAGATASDNYDGDLTGAIVTVNNVDASTTGTYTVTYNVSDASGNDAVQVTRTVNVVSSLSVDDITRLNLKVYPNPTKDYWKLTAKETINSIKLYDAIGRKVLYLTPKSETSEIDATLLANGVYILIINNRKTIRLIKH